VGGEGLAESAEKTLTSQASLGLLLSREKRERGSCGSSVRLKKISPPVILRVRFCRLLFQRGVIRMTTNFPSEAMRGEAR
jgi:hypothetical protein